MIDFIFNNDIIETEELNEKADKGETPEDAVAIIKNVKTLFAQKQKTLYSLVSSRKSF